MTAKQEKPAAQLPTKKVYFPHLMLLYSIAIILVGAINLIGIYTVNPSCLLKKFIFRI